MVFLVGLIVLSAVGLLICAGAIAAPFIMFRFAAVQRDEAERAQQQANEAMRKAVQDAATRRENASEPDKPDRTQPD